ncbi:MAG: AraC family transcriptional regulator [Gemmatimonadetes bacterium]|nr:MAG: AraC family transcriptional regulator [Gemmatimonadota bacterium]
MSWNGGCLFIGRAGGLIPVHAHYAIQVAFGSERGIRFRASEREEWSEYGGVIIPSRQPHAMDATVVPQNVVIFVEPETHEGRALTELYSLSGIMSMPNDAVTKAAALLFSVYRDQRTAPALIDAARQVIRELTHGVDPSVVSDERILRATAYIQRHLSEPLTLEQVAREVFLSPSRFRHLFVEQTGLALRPYILWRRFLRVWELLMAGESLSSAAHTAGFADAAHLTRTSRRMFGFPPSAMLMAGPLPGQQPRESPNAKSQPLRSTG